MAKTNPVFENSLQFAKKMDRTDPLKKFRAKFNYPTARGKSTIYFTGNSLGAQPKTAEKYLTQELQDWAKLGVEGHVHARRPWMDYYKFFKKTLSKLTGARPSEIIAMNQLTINLHLLLVSFYRPTAKRFKIITEFGAFPSDQYALETQVKFHGLDPKDVIIEVKPREGEYTLRTTDILAQIETHRNELALVLFGGVQYYTGQLFDIKKITAAGQAAGAIVGFDLAHAIGNVPLSLHNHNVDFAVWCTYKYLNSGPGAISGIFIHERHGEDTTLPRFAGWYGHDEAERFLMKPGFKPMPGADGWQVSNTSVLHGAAHLASLEIFDQVKMSELRAKSELLTGYAEYLLKEMDPDGDHIVIITPAKPRERGCQLSIYIKENGRDIFNALSKRGVIADWREPNVIRIAPVPLYNTFEEVYTFSTIFRKALRQSMAKRTE